MEKIKSVFEKIIHYAGICGSLLLILIVLTNNEFNNAGMSVVLVTVTIFMIYAIFSIIISSDKKPDVNPDLNSSIFVFGFSMIAVLAVFVRMIAFMLIDVDIMGKRALIAYIYSVLCFVLIYLAGRKMSGHKAGVTSVVIYTLLCPFDIYPAMNNLHNGGTKTELIIDYAATLLMLMSYIAAMSAVNSKTAKSAAMSSLTSGAILGVCIILQKNSVIAAVCMIIMFCLLRTEYKYVSGKDMQSRKFKPYKYVLFFLTGYLIFAAGAIVIPCVAGLSSMMPKWVVILKNFECPADVFRYADDSLKSMWGGIYFERNMFITYSSILLYIFALVASATGCRNALNSKNTKAVFIVTLTIAVSVIGILEGGDVSYIYNLIPFIFVIAGFGISGISKYVYIPVGGISENSPIMPREVEQELTEKIEKKYMLSEGSAAVFVVSEAESESTQSIIDENDSLTEELYYDNEETDDDCKKSEYVVSGEDLDSMLDNLYGNIFTDETDDTQIAEKVSSDGDNDDSKVVIFR